MTRLRSSELLTPFLEHLRALPFVTRASLTFSSRRDSQSDGLLTLLTAGETYDLIVEVKLSYLDRATTNALLAFAEALRRDNLSLIVFARYIPRPTGEQLVAARVNFVDLAGNMHLELGARYARTILGRTDSTKHDTKPLLNAAQLQALFLLAADSAALLWPVRKIAAEAGVSKSKAAEVRRQVLEKYQATPANPAAWPPRAMRDLLLSGYSEVLRPKLLLGVFRTPEPNPEALVARLRNDLPSAEIRFSLTGGPAADLLQHFYRGRETPLFLSHWTPEIQKRLRLLPDRHGSVAVLRAFGTPAFWREVAGLWVAHPLLIYAELMSAVDPRAHEAAEELRREFLEQ